MNKKEKNSKIKEYYEKFKEAWAIPQKRAGIKLLGYLIFFIILFLVAGIISRTSTNKIVDNKTTTTTTKLVDKYNDKQNDLLNNKHNINYIIKIDDIEYKINGTIENNILNGYLESTDNIKKIILENNILYEVKNEEKIALETNIDCNLLDLNNLINKIKQNTSVIETVDNNKNYSYKINYLDKELNIKIYTNENTIYKIELTTDNSNYTLNFDN